MAKNKGTFNQGWWNCFESFAAVSQNEQGLETCMTVLREAGISSREANAWLNKPGYRDPNAEDIVYEYLNSL